MSDEPLTPVDTALDLAMAHYELAWQRARETKQALAAAQAAAAMHYQAEITADHDAKAQLATAEAALHTATLAHYAAMRNKAPAPGVGIREVTTYHYDPQQALQWALEHRLALTLDVRAFESLCKSASTRPAFVQIDPVPVPTIGAALKQG